MGKAVVIALLLSCLAGGVGIWYAQTRAFWERVDGPVTLSLDGVPIGATGVDAIRSASSPLGFRACFTHAASFDPPARLDPAPTVAPGWFDCFDADAIAALVADGRATAATGVKNVAFGVDRVVALAEDGRGWAWHELNACGRKSYDGTVTGEECPDRATYEPLVEGTLDARP